MDLIEFLLPVIAILFALGFIAAKSKRKKKLGTDQILHIIAETGVGAGIYIIFIIFLYAILGFQLNLTSEGSLLYQSGGGAFYYINALSNPSNFLQYLNGVTPNFLVDIFFLIILPIFVIGGLRYCGDSFSKDFVTDFLLYTSFVALPLLTTIITYSILLITKSPYGISNLQPNIPLQVISTFVLGLFLIFLIVKISLHLKKLIMKKLLKLKIITILIVSVVLLFLYVYYYFLPALYIYNSPTLTNSSSSIIQNNITHELRLQIYSNGYGLYPYDNTSSTDVSISLNVSFKKGGSYFIILPEIGNLSSQNLSKGILPNYILDKCTTTTNITCIESTTDSNLNLSYKKFMLIRRTNSTFVGKVNLTMSYGSNNSIRKTFVINTKTNQSCMILNQYCNMSILINNTNKSIANLEFRVFSSNVTLKNGTIFAYGNTFISNKKYCSLSLLYNKTEVDCLYNFGFQHFGNYTSTYYQSLSRFRAMTFTSPYYMEIRGEVPQQSFVNFTLSLTENGLLSPQSSH